MNHSITKAELYTCTIHTTRTPGLQELPCEHSPSNLSLCSQLLSRPLPGTPLFFYTQPNIPAQHSRQQHPSPVSQPNIPAQHPSPAFQPGIPAHCPSPHAHPPHWHHAQWQEDRLQCPWDGVRVQAGTTDGHSKQAAKLMITISAVSSSSQSRSSTPKLQTKKITLPWGQLI